MAYPVPENAGGLRSHGRVLLFPVLVVIIGYLLFSGLGIWYTIWIVTGSEHKWCTVVNTLNSAPPPSRGATKAELAFDASVALALRTLRSELGC